MSELPMSAEERLAALERKVSMMWNGGGDLLGTEGYLQIGNSSTNGSHRFDLRGYQMANNGSAGFGIGATGMWFVPYLHPIPQIGSAGVYPQTVISGFSRPSDGQTQLVIRGQTALNDNVFGAQFIANPTSAVIQLSADSASNDSVTLVLESPDSGDPAAYIQVGATIYDLLGGGGVPTPPLVGTASRYCVGDILSVYNSTAPASATYPASNRAILIPMVVPADCTVVKLWVYNGSTASGNIDLAIYDESYARTISIGSTAQAGAGEVQEFNITDTALTAGRYYLAVAMDNTTGTIQRWNLDSRLMETAGVSYMESAFPLPSTFVPVASGGTAAYLPLIGMSLRTLVT